MELPAFLHRLDADQFTLQPVAILRAAAGIGLGSGRVLLCDPGGSAWGAALPVLPTGAALAAEAPDAGGDPQPGVLPRDRRRLRVRRRSPGVRRCVLPGGETVWGVEPPGRQLLGLSVHRASLDLPADYFADG